MVFWVHSITLWESCVLCRNTIVPIIKKREKIAASIKSIFFIDYKDNTINQNNQIYL